MRVAIYARYSSELQDARSIADQVALARERAEREGWTVSAVYQDAAISGASILNRPGLLKMLADAQAGAFDILLSEDIDRLSRDGEDTHSIYKRLTYAGIKIVTLADGEVGKMHVGIKGLLSSMFLENLAQKTRRGQIGRVAAGRIPGGLCYGYDVVLSMTDKGQRVINPAQRDVVVRIFREYVAGISPIAIAKGLNRDGVPGPRGGMWNQSTLNGSRKRGNGILSNSLYVGEIVHNRQRFIKDPETGRRQARLNPASEWRRQNVPELAIIDPETWAQAQAMRATMSRPHAREARRPKRILSGLMKCGCCGGSYVVRTKTLLGCSRHFNTGACANGRHIQAEEVERRVMSALRAHLLSPDAVAAAVEAYRQERAAAARERLATLQAADRSLADVDRKIERIVAAIEGGADVATLVDRLRTLEAQKRDIEATRPDRSPDVVTLHPQAGSRYREKVEQLHNALSRGASAQSEAAQLFRGMVTEVRITPLAPDQPFAIDIVGDLASLMAPEGAETPATVQLVAGVGFEPTTFRL